MCKAACLICPCRETTAAEPQKRRHEDRADDEGVQEHAEGQGETQLDIPRSVPVIIEANVPAMMTPQLVMIPPVRTTAARRPSARRGGAAPRRLA